MKLHRYIGTVLLGCLLWIAAGCLKDPVPEKLPDLKIVTKPAKGLTTDIFEFNIDPVTSGKVDQNLFYRWDWNGDGIWDTPFSTGNKLSHRFMSPGNLMVRVECADGKKQTKTQDLSILVEQGYSSPRPSFTITPRKGNILTVFTFNAGATKDDEDSLGQLRFRWDLYGAGTWSTDYSKNFTTDFVFSNAGIYHPKLEVRDPSGRIAALSQELVVTMEDTLIIADFSIHSDLIRVGDTVVLDASASHHSTNPNRKFLYSWLLPALSEWSSNEEEKLKEIIIGQEGRFTITLKVTDKETKLFNEVTKEFLAIGKNLPPKAKIQIGGLYGNIQSQFYLDSWASSDDNLAPSQLEVRWDFDGDGAWDTPYSLEKVVFHQFDSPGEYQVTLQVKDDRGLSDTDSQRVLISANTNQTGFMKDQRDNTYYGTVKIGDQWWMSQNLNYSIPQKEVRGIYQWICLFEQSKWCEQVGKMYRVGVVVRSEADAEYIEICPPGWRLPDREDWETLFTSIGGKEYGKELRYGGKYDFNALDMGFADYYILKIFPDSPPIDTIYRFKQTYELSWFVSGTQFIDPIIVDNVWMWSVDRATGTTWTGFGLADIYMPVRCLKKD